MRSEALKGLLGIWSLDLSVLHDFFFSMQRTSRFCYFISREGSQWSQGHYNDCRLKVAFVCSFFVNFLLLFLFTFFFYLWGLLWKTMNKYWWWRCCKFLLFASRSCFLLTFVAWKINRMILFVPIVFVDFFWRGKINRIIL